MNTPTLNIARGTTDKPVATDALIDNLRDLDLNGELFVGYPIMASPDGPYAIDALLVSPEHGLVCFDLVEGLNLGDYVARQDEAYNRLYARLMPHRNLVRHRTLLPCIGTLTYAPAVERTPGSQEHPVLNQSTLVPGLKKFVWEDSSQELYEGTLSAIENVTAIRRPSGSRSPRTPGSRADRLHSVENSISTLDRSQSKAMIKPWMESRGSGASGIREDNRSRTKSGIPPCQASRMAHRDYLPHPLPKKPLHTTHHQLRDRTDWRGTGLGQDSNHQFVGRTGRVRSRWALLRVLQNP